MRALPQIAKSQEKKRAYADVMDEKRLTITLKGKGKAKEEVRISPPPDERPRVKKPKRAETRPCPVCDEAIPLRLMNRHAQLEMERVEEIMKQIGSSEPILLADEFDDMSRPGPSTGVPARRSAIKALRSFTSSPASSTTNEHIVKTIQTIQRRRKQRHVRFKEAAREEEEGYFERSWWTKRHEASNDEILCPVCSQGVRGDQDVINAHVDTCLAAESWRLEEERAKRDSSTVDEDGWDGRFNRVLPNGAVGHVGNVRGTGFHTRDPTSRDVDDEVDIDGDEIDIYGEAQFTEGDIVPVVEYFSQELDEDTDVEIEENHSETTKSRQKSLRDLVAEGKLLKRQTLQGGELESDVVKCQSIEAESIDTAIADAKKKGDNAALVIALEDKIMQLKSTRVSPSATLLCRICLESYTEPTVSTGCWHACCRECWLRCLGSTKLCPICKRITGAADLRRIYL